jgi:hypothetical protein
VDGFTSVPGWRYTKPDKHGIWGTYVKDDGDDYYVPGSARKFIPTRSRKQQKQEPAVEHLTSNWSGLFSHKSSLNKAQRLDLLERGLTDEMIESWGFYRVEQDGKLPVFVSGADPKALTWKNGSGYLIPMRDWKGEHVGSQVKLDRAGGRKYSWTATYDSKTKKKLASAHYEVSPGVSELPLNVVLPPSRANQRPGEFDIVVLCEGALKPMVAAAKWGEQLNAVFIGAAGGLFTSSPVQLKEALRAFSSAQVVFAPDAGSLSNSQVLARDAKTVAHLEGLVGSVKVMFWGQGFDKETGDIDEIASLDAVRYISYSEYVADVLNFNGDGAESYEELVVTLQGREVLPGRRVGVPKQMPAHLLVKALAPYSSDRSIVIDGSADPSWVNLISNELSVNIRLKDGSEVSRLVWWNRKSISLTPNRITQATSLSDGRYFPVPKLRGAKLVGIKAAQGCGKTEALRQLTKNCRNLLVITHRRTLVGALSDKLDCEDIENVKGYGTVSGIPKLALCVDSIIQLDPEDYEGCVIVLDEFRQLLRHACFASTEIAKRRSHALSIFRELLRVASLVFISDADLTDLEIDVATELCGLSGEDVEVYTHTHLPAKGRKLELCDRPQDLLNRLEEALKALPPGEKIYIATSGQKVESKLGTINLEKLINQKYPNLRVLRVDQESHGDVGHPAYQACSDIREAIADYDVIIASPTLATGVSIEADIRFSKVFGIASGLLSPEDVVQQLERVRYGCDRVVYAANNASGLGRVGNGSPLASAWLSESKSSNNKGEQYAYGIYERTLKTLDGAHESEGGKDNLWLSLASNYAALTNAFSVHYRDAIVLLLTHHRGYSLGVSHEGGDKALLEELKAVKQGSVDEHLTAVATAPVLSSEEEDKLDQKQALTTSERLALEQRKTFKRVCLDTEPGQTEYLSRTDQGLVARKALIADNRDGYLSKLWLRYSLTDGHMATRLSAILRHAISSLKDGKKDSRNTFALDSPFAYLAQVYALSEAGADVVLSLDGKTIDSTNPLIEEFNAQYYAVSKIAGFKQYLPSGGRGKKSPITPIRGIARKLGMEVKTTRTTSNGKKVTNYEFYTPSKPWLDSSVNSKYDSLDGLFALWTDKELDRIEALGDFLLEKHPEVTLEPIADTEPIETEALACTTKAELEDRLSREDLIALRLFGDTKVHQHLMNLELTVGGEPSTLCSKAYRVANDLGEAVVLTASKVFDVIYTGFLGGLITAQEAIQSVGNDTYQLFWGSSFTDEERRLINEAAAEARSVAAQAFSKFAVSS